MLRRAVIGILLLALSAAVLIGCMRVELHVTVNEDGSGQFAYTLAVSDTFADVMGEEASISADDLADLPENATLMEYSEDGYSGLIVTIPFDDYSDIPNTGSGDFDDFVETMRIEETDNGGWRFSMDLSGDDALGGMSDAEDLDAEFAALAGGFLDDGWFRIWLHLPGEPVENNADRIEDDGALVWEADLGDLANFESRTLTAVTEPPASGLETPALIGFAVIGGVLLILLVILFVRKRNTP